MLIQEELKEFHKLKAKKEAEREKLSYLVLHMRKFVMEAGWVPNKLDADDIIDISHMRSKCLQPGEELLPEDDFNSLHLPFHLWCLTKPTFYIPQFFKTMIRFHITLSFLFLLFATTTTSRFNALPPAVAFPGPLHSTEQLFIPSIAMPPASSDLNSEKRRVPTGSNPLHNKRKF
ncbi:hypothetical protein L2E82_02272 [Cichorium intybus]|uniref:Uncharacterized protein n=1 Tax=Cichorium intybus TaxID=13427 RepID=A0ACB9H2A9_CICIN|nr:hypothetical protein L2E82_02272 [Cichorium intybus]